jgi:hypothetical protein
MLTVTKSSKGHEGPKINYRILTIREIRYGIIAEHIEFTDLCNAIRPPLWSSGQSSWLQIRRPRFDSRYYQKKKSSGSGTGSTQPREYN